MVSSKGNKVLTVGDKVRFKGDWYTLVCYSENSFTICNEGSKRKEDIRTHKGDPYFCLFKER